MKKRKIMRNLKFLTTNFWILLFSWPCPCRKWPDRCTSCLFWVSCRRFSWRWMSQRLSCLSLPWRSFCWIGAMGLAKCGTVFDAAYTSCPLCVPARMSMMSGRLASKTGILNNYAILPDSIPTIAHAFAAKPQFIESNQACFIAGYNLY